MRRLLIVVGLTVTLVGCGGGNGESADTADTATGGGTVATDTTPRDTTAPDDTSPSDTSPSETAATTTAAPTSEPSVTDPPVESPLEGVGSIAVETTDGDRPRFSWDEVNGAVEYSLVVATTGGDVVWAWRGRDTSVDLGAGLIEGNEGPRISTDSVIDVFALAADGTIVAASGPVPISP